MRKEVQIILNTGSSEAIEAPKVVEDGAAAAEADANADTTQTQSKHEPPFKVINHGEVQVSFRSKAIVLSNGGQ